MISFVGGNQLSRGALPAGAMEPRAGWDDTDIYAGEREAEHVLRDRVGVETLSSEARLNRLHSFQPVMQLRRVLSFWMTMPGLP